MLFCFVYWAGNRTIAAGLPVSDYGESDWNYVSLGWCVLAAVLGVSCMSPCACWVVCLCRLTQTNFQSNKPATNKPVSKVMSVRYADAIYSHMNMLMVRWSNVMYMLSHICTIYMHIVCMLCSIYFTCSDVSQRNVCFTLHLSPQRRVGGNRSFPIIWCDFRSRPLILRFPP